MILHIVACLLKARMVEPAEMAVAREQLCKCHVSVATFAHAKIEVPLRTVFSMRSAAQTTSRRNYKKRYLLCGPYRGYIRTAISGFK
jgi:hypothetical protein